MESATTAVTASMLGECWIWRESKTDECSKHDEEITRAETVHNPYLPLCLGEHF
jgi:hypothetical protein